MSIETSTVQEDCVAASTPAQAPPRESRHSLFAAVAVTVTVSIGVAGYE